MDIRLLQFLKGLSLQRLITMILNQEKPYKLSAKALGKILVASPENIYKWKRGHLPTKQFAHTKPLLISKIEDGEIKLSEKTLEKLWQELESKKYPSTSDKDLNNQAQNQEEKYSNDPLIGIYIMEHYRQEVYKGNKVVTGTITHIRDKPVLIAYDRPSPFTGDVNGHMEVPDNSMEPKYERNSVVAIRKLEFVNDYVPGYNYLIIDKSYQRYIRRMEEVEKGLCRLVPINPSYPVIEKKIEDIIAIFKVEGGHVKG